MNWIVLVVEFLLKFEILIFKFVIYYGKKLGGRRLNYVDALNWLNSLTKLNVERYNLSAINKLLENLGRPDRKLKFVHIAGTNGKGSVAKMCSEVLVASGKKTGLFISPHILNFNERIQINGKFITNYDLLFLVNKIRPVVENLTKIGVFCSKFDVLTAIAFVYFDLNKCDIVVLEVGLGGRLDSTNVILNSEISIITKIGFDHENVLGTTLQQIAFEKAGIIKQNGVCVCSSCESEQVCKVLKQVCLKKNAELIVAYAPENEEIDFMHTCFRFQGVKFCLGLCGFFQLENAMIVITAMLKLGISIQCVKIALERVRWPARFEVFNNKQPVLILDGAHNVDGVLALKQALFLCPFQPKIGVVSMLERKNYKNVLKELKFMNFNKVVLTQMCDDGVAAVENLQKYAKFYDLNFVVEKNFVNALKIAENFATKQGVVVVFGSLYFVSQVRKILC